MTTTICEVCQRRVAITRFRQVELHGGQPGKFCAGSGKPVDTIAIDAHLACNRNLLKSGARMPRKP